MSTPVILIFDVGKTNKKIWLFDEQYKAVHEETTQLKEIQDEDGFPCEDVFALTQWIKDSFARLRNIPQFEIKTVNFSGYGASFVYLDNDSGVIPPLYNYLKPYPQRLLEEFYKENGGQSQFTKVTASPVLGNLNSGMQLYRLKKEMPGKFSRIKYALHLPQYLSFVLSSSLCSDITSVGCHTNLWNFEIDKYHQWVETEAIVEKLPPFRPCNAIAGYAEKIAAGGGLHDSSASLIPYLTFFTEPFILLSTGTWCISMNPFNHTLLSDDELQQDCLCYLSFEGKPVKASRLFAGHEHEQQVKRLASHYQTAVDRYKKVNVDFEMLKKVRARRSSVYSAHHGAMVAQSIFATRDLSRFNNYEEAYHRLIADLTEQQVRSTNLIINGSRVARIFVDGGFGSNSIYMHMLAEAFPGIEVYGASVPQASALGAALVLHPHWNSKQLPSDLIELKLYSVTGKTST